eukprot:TRINITY_DN79912_c0_g1_i1.p1 TRINITY_DN79912_c0_g1~~TRINITY_DN79912_c0_g1_i1.p1  ORF type:complete len:931 (-),score=287.51 TRINITY_DN79912_c0_g1_i1:123-2855(-)
MAWQQMQQKGGSIPAFVGGKGAAKPAMIGSLGGMQAGMQRPGAPVPLRAAQTGIVQQAQIRQMGVGGAAVAGAGAAAGGSLTVSGCQNLTVGNIIKGTYSTAGANHGKPVYKKDGSPNGVNVLIYFWDDRDGPSFSGWWFGPKVGGDQVWAYNGQKVSPTPPLSNWRVPWDGEEDPQLRLTFGQAARAMGIQQPGAVGGVRMTGLQDNSQMADRKRQVEEARKRQAEREQEQQKKQAELKAKREQEEARRKESSAALAVRKAIQKVRTATPENYDELMGQLEEAQAANLEAMGSQAEKVSQEAQAALEQAQKRIDQMNEEKIQEEQKKIDEEKQKVEQEEKIKVYVEEATTEANAMLEKIKAAEEMAQKLDELSSGTPESMVSAADQTEKTIEETREEARTSRQKIIDKQKELGDSAALRKIKRDVLELTSKLAGGMRQLEKYGTVVKNTKLKAEKKGNALKKEEERKTTFKKFDKDKDGKLSRKEVETYCKEVIDHQLAADVMDRIMKSLEPIAFDKFRAMHQKVCIAKSEALARQRRAEEEAKAKVVEEKRAAVQVILDEALKLYQTAEASVAEAETKSRPLLKDENLDSAEIRATCTEVETILKRVEEETSQAAEKLKKAKGDCEAEEDLKSFGQQVMTRCERIEGRSKSRVAKVEAAMKLAKDKATRKDFVEIDGKRTDFVTAIRAKMTEEGKTSEQLFESINAGKAVSEDAFKTLLQGLAGLELAEGQPAKLFSHVAGETSEISKDRFKELLRLYYKCVKATVLSEECSIKSKTVRRLDVGEVLEALEGPSLDEGAGVKRVKCQATQDNATGWVTLAGNQGTPFLEPGGNFYTCIMETLITDALSVQDSKTIRRISKGEVIEVIEFPKKDDATDVRRIKGKAQVDGVEGWITVSSSSGTKFLEPC